MVGHLHMLWWWAMDYAPEGELSKFEHDDIADAMQWEGDPDQLVSVLTDARFLDKNGCELVIHDWFDYAGRLLEKREQNNERKRRSREKKKKSEDGHADVTRDGNVTSEGVTGLPNLTEPNQPNLPTQKEFPPESLPPTGDAPSHDPKKGKGSKEKPKYDEDNPYYKMASYFKTKVDEMANAEGLTHLTAKTNLQTWANDFRLLVEVDKHEDKNLIRKVMDWVVTDSFWKSNVLSASKFRDQFPKLVLEMRRPKQGKKYSGTSKKTKIDVVPSVTDGHHVSDEEMAEMMEYARQMSGKPDA